MERRSRAIMPDIPPTRASLLVRLRDRHDAAAWREFVDLYGPVVYGYARKQGLQDADAADLCQEVFRAFAGAASRFVYDPRRGAFRNWLFTIVRRKLATWRQAQRSRHADADAGANGHILEQCPAADDSEAAWEAAWRQQVFQWACAEARRHVSDVTWQAFWRTAMDGAPGKQVAAELGLSVAAVYLARSRVAARLRELVQTAQET